MDQELLPDARKAVRGVMVYGFQLPIYPAYEVAVSDVPHEQE
jgi:hypothetical protein